MQEAGGAAARTGDLLVEVEGRTHVVPAGSAWLIGRSPVAQIRVEGGHDLVSREHLWLRGESGDWHVQDVSRNGTYDAGQRVQSLALTGPTFLHLGAADGVPVRLTPSRSRPGGGQTGPQDWARTPSAVHEMTVGVIRIGRADTNDVVLTDLLVSRHHAEIRTTAQGPELIDLRSGNGTFVGGQRIERAVLRPGDLVTIGRHTLEFDGTQLVEYLDSGDIRFAATNLVVTLSGGKRILDDVSFSLGPRKVMAIVGPSGAGKSTLLGALTGIRPADAGQVLYGGRDLYASYDELRQRIGLVPQQDILHQSLTLKQALEYGAELRFPADVTAKERAARVREVIEELSLTPQTGTRISSMSGGERKRASTALELLTKPSLLFLDEPTSGLDTDLDRDVMARLRKLADEGRTVVVVTHNLVHLQTVDVVMVLARGGHLAYLGPPSEAFAYFGVSSWADLFGVLKTRKGPDWAADFRQRFQPSHSQIVAEQRPATARMTPVRRRSGLSQFSTLARRYVAVTASDRTLIAIVLLLPAFLALIARIVPADDGLAALDLPNRGARQLLLVLAFGAALMGAASGVRELVKERPIYLRERAIGLSLPAYVASKVVVLGFVALLQGLALTLLAVSWHPPPEDGNLLPSPVWEVVVAISVLCAVSAVIGLVISALVKDENQAMPLLVLVTMAQLVLCGGLVPITGRNVLQQISWLMPARWGFAAESSTVNLNYLEAGYQHSDRLWDHTLGTWLGDMGALFGLGAVAVVVLTLLVRRLDPNRSAR